MWETLKQGLIDNRIDLAFLPEMDSQLFYEGSAAPSGWCSLLCCWGWQR